TTSPPLAGSRSSAMGRGMLSPKPARLPPAPASRPRVRRQREHEAARPRPALDPDLAAVRLDHPAGDVERDPVAGAARAPLAPRRRRRRQLEDGGALLLRHARA